MSAARGQVGFFDEILVYFFELALHLVCLSDRTRKLLSLTVAHQVNLILLRVSPLLHFLAFFNLRLQLLIQVPNNGRIWFYFSRFLMVYCLFNLAQYRIIFLHFPKVDWDSIFGRLSIIYKSVYWILIHNLSFINWIIRIV